MAEQTKSVKNRRNLWIGLCSAWTVLIVGLVGWGLYRGKHPEEMYDLEILGLPADTVWCHAGYESGRGTLPLEVYDWEAILLSGPSVFYARMPNGRYGPESSTSAPDQGVRWHMAAKYVVVYRDVRGGWHRRWIPADQVTTTGGAREPRKGTKSIQVRDANPLDVPTQDELQAWGIRHGIPGDIYWEESVPGLQGEESDRTSKFYVEATLGSLQKHLERVEHFLKEENSEFACILASRICLLAVPTVEALPTRSRDQLAAAEELRDSYEKFVRALTSDPAAAIEFPTRWRRLLKRMSGS